jgi:hypothetical protein
MIGSHADWSWGFAGQGLGTRAMVMRIPAALR